MRFYSLILNKCCLVIKLPLQVLIVGYVGDSVVLPCSSELNTEDITVHWRHNDTLKVYDIINGKVSVEEQDSVYKNRTESFPQSYKTGNFSLKLNNLQYNDTGNYTCHITNELLIHTMEILVKVQLSFCPLEKDHGTQSRTEKIVTLVAFAFCSHSVLYLCILTREAVCLLITVSVLAYSGFLCGGMSFQT
uniref:Ig-like domain-containing protein n=1 Tax=Cyprinus carpio TaxID=7962 RepID=A0A8C1XGD9_CYPCA